MSVDTQARQFADQPLEFFGGSYRDMHTLPAQQLEQLQLAALRHRFDDLHGRLGVLTAMAEDTGVDQLDSLDDAVPLLFSPEVYKSYPVSLLTSGRFDRLTRWLSQLTTVDLSAADVSTCDSIDSWLAELDTTTELRVQHSSVTSGTMSFVPHTVAELDAMFSVVRQRVLRDGEQHLPVVWPMIRTGRSGIMRCIDMLARYLAGAEDRVYALHPGRMSADVMLLAGQIAAARTRGESARLDPALLARRDEFDALRRETDTAMPQFVARLADELRGARVYCMNTWNVIHAMASTGLEQDITGLFAPDSVIEPGGGTKGADIPDDWQDRVRRFTGVPALQHIYAMTETTALHPMCTAGRYHIEPWTVLYVLDPTTGTPLPRQGQQTGRAAFHDLLARTHWGGFRSDDHITASFAPCDCGRTTPQVLDGITRFSDIKDGDKINCAATDNAHRTALNYLVSEPR